MLSRLEIAVNQAITDFDEIKAAIESKGIQIPKGTDTREYAALIKSIGTGKTYILRDETGAELVATVVGEETVFTATANDIREGMVAATDKGVTTGTKVIPSYLTTEGYAIAMVGQSITLSFADSGLYDYTKLQVIICPFNTTVEESVAAEKVVINDKIYVVQSTESIGAITKNHDTEQIEFGITNDGTVPWIIRYFTYKEIE